MPELITLVATAVGGLGFSAGLGVAATNLLIYGVTGFLTSALYSGLSFLATSLLTPKQRAPRPEDVQQSIKQTTAPRYKHYGRVKVSGPWVFGETKNGTFYKIVALGVGPFDEIEEYWIDDVKVTLDVSGVASGGRFNDLTATEKPIIKTRLGIENETHYSELTSVFPEWTANHKGRGVASLFSTQKPLPQAKVNSAYPSYSNTTFLVVAKASKVLNPISNAVEWSENPSAIIRDFMTSPDGMRLPVSVLNTPQGIESLITAFNKSSFLYNLKNGGTEPRYRIWGSYALNERPGDVLNRLLASCDARLKLTQDGGITIEVGDWEEPTVTIDETMILAFSDVGRGKDILNTANTIKATFTDPNADYKTAEADIWVDEEDVSERGEFVQDLEFNMVPSHSQTRRLMKIQSYRSNPSWKGVFTCNLKAMKAFNERFIRLKFAPFGIDENFEITDFRFDLGENNILRSVTIQVQSISKEAYDWNPTLEEGNAPVADQILTSNAIPLPQNFAITQERYNNLPYARLSFDESLIVSLKTEARGKKVSETNWIPIPFLEEEETTLSFAMDDGSLYEFQVRHISSTGRKGAWTPSLQILATADITAPSPVNTVSRTGGAGQVTINWKTPNSKNFNRTIIKRATTNVEANSVEISSSPFYNSPNTTTSFINTGLSAGSYYYWLYASNSSGVLSTGVATGLATVT